MSTRIKSRAELDEIVDPSSAGGERSPEGERSETLALRVSGKTPGRWSSRRSCCSRT
jgi:hypothetical protein